MKLLTVEEVAQRLHVREGWVYQHVRSGDIPHVRVGRYLRFEEEALNDWIKSRSVGASENRSRRR